ncbi:MULTISPECIES: hypothetical protein [Paraburkholderia]|jgi:hypothetical protein|uniref:Uncharacterized protein n=1 Tax=Paraburkholderia tropica TaxID=92647 RepID=A0A1A5X509_9BURK|nr:MULTISPECIES: hypothetical protein [Paraburkholderia]MBB2983732.1 hypothetical protein [Paraburkholderia tropica]MBB3002513.1 hypothetical protein [Paraburkholderia tropica]MBB6317643.1 hypothetical protein [Paraburkholderia tropica]MBN3812357.1 hypothetical protein [Paraburkholderia sp. Ac-20347]MDE1142704.1 hypothetical protein [Paraburkholderia tropica]
MAPHLNGRYFVDDHEIPEPQAANRWFSYAQQHGIDVARAISVWEDAATLDGETSRATVAGCGIRIVPPEV